LCSEVKHAKHLHAVRRDSVFLLDNSDVTKAEGLNQHLDDGVMRHGFVG
jgi:hypothetical protein